MEPRRSKRSKCKSLKENHDQILNNTDVNINNLNNDCLLEVFKYLSIKERVKASRICKRWAYIYELSWSSITYLFINDKLLKNKCENNETIRKQYATSVIKLLKKCGSFLKTVRIGGNLGCRNTNEILQNIAKYCNNILDFTLDDIRDYCIGDQMLLPVFVSNPNLCRISLNHLNIKENCLSKLKPQIIEEFKTNNCMFKSKNYFHDFISQLKNVKKISISNDSNSYEIIQSLIESDCENISEFSLFSSVPCSELLNLLTKQKNLKKLQLENVNVNKNFLNNLPKNFLEHLSLRLHHSISYQIHQFKFLKDLDCDIDTLTDDFMNGLTECLNLKELKIDVLLEINLSEIGINYFSQLKNLELFDLEANENIDKILVSVGRCENLKTLKIKYCKFTELAFKGSSSFLNLVNLDASLTNVSNQSLTDLVSKSLKLKELIINQCTNVSNKFIEIASDIKINRKDESCLKIIYCDYLYSKIQPKNLNNISELITFKKLPYKSYLNN